MLQLDRTSAAVPPGPRSKLPSLTGLRFGAALIVFLTHTSVTYSPVPPYAAVNPFGDGGLATAYEFVLAPGGYVGVSFFFVLSGFVLLWSSRPGEPGRAFLRRRIVKIFPNHIVTWAIAMVLFAAAVTPVTQWLPNLLLLHAWSMNSFAWVSVNPLSWSLCAELLFYALFPLLLGPVLRIRESRLWGWAAALVAGLGALVLLNLYVVPNVLPDTSDPSLETPVTSAQFWIGYFFPPSRLFEFVLGMVLARLVMAGKWPRITVPPAIALMAAGYVATLYVPYVFRFNLTTLIPIAVLVAAVADADLRGGWTGLRSRTAQWLGEISFGFYMVQGIVLLYGRTLFDSATYSTPVGIAVLVAFLVANLVAAWLLYTCVERPAMRRWSRRRPSSRLRTPVPSGSGTADV